LGSSAELQSAFPDHIATQLVRALTTTDGLNEFFESAIPPLAESFGTDRAILVDFRENTGHFDLLLWVGYPTQSRFDLQRRIGEMDLRRAIAEKDPFFAGNQQRIVVLPLYFMTTLEAVIVFEAEAPIELTPARREVAKIISKVIGLLMSSNRLSINKTGSVDFSDLERARQIQRTYLPADNLQTDHYEVFGYNQSSALVGGDYFDYFRLRENSIQCVLADASGHGLSAALIMSTFRALLHAEIDQWHDCAELFSVLNRSVHSGSSIVQYLTSVFLDYDEKTRLLRYINAGHFDPAVVRADGTIERLKGGGPPLGMFGNSVYCAAQAEIGCGDLMVLFTDGLTDLRNASDDFFGEERILESVQRHRRQPLQEIASVLLNDGKSFSAVPQPEDDLTLFLLRFH
jgi:serine phosphatase RsbU (regulator of sigma subunit)